MLWINIKNNYETYLINYSKQLARAKQRLVTYESNIIYRLAVKKLLNTNTI